MTVVLLVLPILIAAGAIGYVIGHSGEGSSAPPPRQTPSASAPSTSTTQVSQTTVTTLPGGSDQEGELTAAQTIDLQQADLPSGYVAHGSGPSLPPPDQTVTPCTPVSGQGYLASYYAAYGSLAAAQSIAGDVWIMPTTAVAQGAVNAVLAPSFGPGCLQAEFDAEAKRSDYGYAEAANCGSLVLGSSSIAPLPSPDLGWLYRAVNVCSVRSDTGTNYRYYASLLAMDGPVIVQIDSISESSSVAQDEAAIAAMKSRASQYVASTVSA
jgi:Na+-transporting methylmalonyl-CoA/oxaloacetate decarboxylase gamma subunit